MISQIARNIPVEKRESLEIIETLADRVEFAGIGSPSTARAKTTARSSRTTKSSKPKMPAGETRQPNF